MRVKIDAGHVELYDHMVMPPHLKVVNVARASFAKTVEEFTDKDEKLLRWLVAHNHTSPFRHSMITLHVKCPEFVARQWYKHIIGAEYTFKDSGWNEVSGRYVRYTEFYVPDDLHYQAATKKQGASPDVHKSSANFILEWSMLNEQAVKLYNAMLDVGVANEEARVILPMGLYTEFYWTASVQALQHFVALRTASDAQGLMRTYAMAVNDVCAQHYGILWDILSEAMQGK